MILLVVRNSHSTMLKARVEHKTCIYRAWYRTPNAQVIFTNQTYIQAMWPFYVMLLDFYRCIIVYQRHRALSKGLDVMDGAVLTVFP